MANFAKLNENNVVLEVICVSNVELLDDSGNESEAKGVAFLTDWSGGHTNWKQSSINNRIRRRHAPIGGTYDPVNDVFIHLKPFPSWTLNPTTFEWDAPVPRPTGGLPCFWNEETVSWDLINYPMIEETGRVINDLPVTNVGGSNA